MAIPETNPIIFIIMISEASGNIKDLLKHVAQLWSHQTTRNKLIIQAWMRKNESSGCTGVACSGLQTGSIACETDPTCATGYTGTPAESDYSCLAEGEELTIGGCTIQTCDVSVVTAPSNGQYGSILVLHRPPKSAMERKEQAPKPSRRWKGKV